MISSTVWNTHMMSRVDRSARRHVTHVCCAIVVLQAHGGELVLGILVARTRTVHLFCSFGSRRLTASFCPVPCEHCEVSQERVASKLHFSRTEPSTLVEVDAYFEPTDVNCVAPVEDSGVAVKLEATADTGILWWTRAGTLPQV